MFEIEKIVDVHHYADGLRVNKAGKAVKNRGQYLEYCFRVAMGVDPMDAKADNLNACKGCDFGNVSIKSARFSLSCAQAMQGQGLENLLRECLKNDMAERYAYLTDGNGAMNTIKVYEMDIATFEKFVLTFAKVELESDKNGGKEKIRFPRENKKILRWLDENVL